MRSSRAYSARTQGAAHVFAALLLSVALAAALGWSFVPAGRAAALPPTPGGPSTPTKPLPRGPLAAGLTPVPATAVLPASVLAGAGAQVVINEVVTDPQHDWSGNDFNGLPADGTVSSADEYVELYIKAAGLDLTGWTIELLDSSPHSGDLTGDGAFRASRYFGAGSLAHTAAGDFVLLGNPRGALNNEILVVLRDDQGQVVDQVQLGPGGAPGGAATGPNDEAVARFPNGSDTGDDAFDFVKRPASPGAVNAPGAQPVPSPTPGAYAPLSIIINEIAWAGTLASANDEWLELYNPTGADVNLKGWTLSDGGDLSLVFPPLVVPPGGYVLLERTSDSTVSDIPADLIYTGGLSNDGETLTLRDAHGTLIDTANAAGGPWPAGGGSEYATLERLSPGPDAPDNWQANTGLSRVGHDADGNPLRGTARAPNSAAAPPTATLVAPSAAGVVVNEFLPRPGAGGAEFIELFNPTGAAVDLSGWQLDDAPGGSGPYTLPAGTVLAPGGFAVFYASDTGLALNDDGDSVRLLLPGGAVADEFAYAGPAAVGVSWARLPDGGGWRADGVPTPGGPNQAAPAPPGLGAVSIAELRTWPEGAWVTLTARVSVPAGVFGPRTVHVYDGTGGLTLYLGRDDWPPLAVGQRLTVLGYLRRRNGDLQLYARNAWHLSVGPAADLAPLNPLAVTTGQVGEGVEGALVSVLGRVTRIEGSSLWLDDGSGAARVFFPAATGLARPAAQVGQLWRITGVVVEFTTAASSAPNHRLQPRFAGDLALVADAGLGTPVPAATGVVEEVEATETVVP